MDNQNRIKGLSGMTASVSTPNAGRRFRSCVTAVGTRKSPGLGHFYAEEVSIVINISHFRSITSISDVRGEQEGIFPTTVPHGCHDNNDDDDE
jgi:hypothetical protein